MKNPSQSIQDISPPPEKLKRLDDNSPEKLKRVDDNSPRKSKRRDDGRSFHWTAPGYKSKSFYPPGIDRFSPMHDFDDDPDDKREKKPVQIQMKNGPMIDLASDEIEQFEIFRV